jgi:hypothetical protein
MKNYQIGKHWNNAKQLESSNFPQLPTPSAAPFYLFFSWKRSFGWWTCSRIPIGAALPVGDLGQLSIDQTILGVLGQYLVSTRLVLRCSGNSDPIYLGLLQPDPLHPRENPWTKRGLHKSSERLQKVWQLKSQWIIPGCCDNWSIDCIDITVYVCYMMLLIQSLGKSRWFPSLNALGRLIPPT